jgi:hypothetical protein
MPKMKQTRDKPDVASWRNKLDEQGLRILDEYRQVKLKALGDQKKRGSKDWIDELIETVGKQQSKSAQTEKLPDLKLETDSTLTDEQIRVAIREAISSIETPSPADLWGPISSIFEQLGPKGRRSISLLFAMLSSFLMSEFQGVRKRHFGDDALTERQLFWVLGMTLETIGKQFRTGDPSPPMKGRVNVELVEFIKLIKKHQKPEMNLSYRELKTALEHVLIHTPNEEALRLFVHRAQKRGWL